MTSRTRQRERAKSGVVALLVTAYCLVMLGWRVTLGLAVIIACGWVVFDYLPYRARIKRIRSGQ